VPVSFDDTVVVPEGYKVQVLGAWGEPISGDMPAYSPATPAPSRACRSASTMTGCISSRSTARPRTASGAINHEYIEPRFLHADKYKGLELTSWTGRLRRRRQARRRRGAEGAERPRRLDLPHRAQADGSWAIVPMPHNRRITGLTPMEIAARSAARRTW
jgi:uncharacterized protein